MNEKTELGLSVLRQALVEYVSRRHCRDPFEDEDETRENLRPYVAARYCTHPQKFQDDKLVYLLPRIRKAYAMLRAMAED